MKEENKKRLKNIVVVLVIIVLLSFFIIPVISVIVHQNTVNEMNEMAKDTAFVNWLLNQ